MLKHDNAQSNKSSEGSSALSAGFKALQLLENAGYEAYYVGGCVRDRIMGRSADDIDIATSALPHQIKNVFADKTVIETGIRHGTVTVLMPQPLEITTYRMEGSYSDGRHPDKVYFVSSLLEDLQRRDFTINAIAERSDGSCVDPFGGKLDIENKKIRAVGNAGERFCEDALRIMRALRFSAVLGFDIEENTEKALFAHKDLLKAIAPERLFSEFCKLIEGVNAADTIRRYVDIIGVIIPELAAMKGFEQHNPYHKYDVLEHCIRAMEAINTDKDNHLYMKISALFHDIGKPLTYSEDENGIGHFYRHPSVSSRLSKEILSRFNADSFTTERVALITKYHDLLFETDRRLLKKWMSKFTPQVLLEILEIKRADNFATGNMSDDLKRKFDDTEKLIYEILDEHQCFSMKYLAINGHDLIALGMKEGPGIGIALAALLEDVICERLQNERAVLLAEAAKRFINKNSCG